MKIEKFEDLEIWKTSTDVAIQIYQLTNKKDFSKDYGLRDQIRRAVVSISSNIVEGFEINNNNDFIRFLRIAKGSAGETINQLYIAYQLNYINTQEFEKLNFELESLSPKIGKLIHYLINKKNTNEFQTR